MNHWVARVLWLGPSGDVVQKLNELTRVTKLSGAFPDIEAMLGAFDSHIRFWFSSGPRLGMDEWLDGVVERLKAINAEQPLLPIPIKVQVLVLEYQEDMGPQYELMLQVAPESQEVVRTYNQIRELKIQEALSRLMPIVILKEEDVVESDGWDDDPLGMETEENRYALVLRGSRAASPRG